jgi:uncharacterized membrane protein YvbJ
MKKCMLCGWEESDESRFTCPACGEATWGPGSSQASDEPKPEESAPAKRGPGRPRKA